jgi:hypothetical protein
MPISAQLCLRRRVLAVPSLVAAVCSADLRPAAVCAEAATLRGLGPPRHCAALRVEVSGVALFFKRFNHRW